MEQDNRIPKELSDYVEGFKDRLSSFSYLRKNLVDVSKMFGLGFLTILKNYVTGYRKIGHYKQKREELSGKQSYFDLFTFAISTLSKPLALSYDLTSLCNLSCPDCYKQVLNKHGERPSEIEDDLFLDRLEYVYQNFPEVPTFIMGGEPTVKPKRLAAALELSVDYNAPVKISTNGFINIVDRASFDDNYNKLLNVMQNNSNLIIFLCSLGDTKPEIHEEIRKGGKYESSIHNCKKLIQKGVRVTADLFINPKNYQRFKEMLDNLREIGFDGTMVNFHTYVPRAGDPLPDYIMTERFRSEASEIIKDVLRDDYYGYFVRGITPKAAEMFHSDNLSKVFDKRICPTANRMLSFDHRMIPIFPCSFGGEVYCNTEHEEYGKIGCGLWLPALYGAAVRGDPGSLRHFMKEAFSRNL